MTPAFSVVICTYNRASLVPRAIESVIAQGFFEFELIVVDDGSVDNTREVVTGINERRLHYVHRSNGGLSAARNTGVAHASGRHVVFLDDDDEALPGWLGRLHEGTGGDPNAVVTCGELVVDEEGTTVATTRPRPLGPAFEEYRGLFVPGTFAVSRALYHEVGGFAEQLQCSHQTEFALRLLPLCRQRGLPVNAIDEPLVRHVLRPAEQRLRTPAKVLSGTSYILDRHMPRLARSPGLLSNYLATAGIAAARTGDYGEARRLLRRAVAAQPRRWKHALRLGLACLPPLGDQVWKTARYRQPPVPVP